MDNNKARELANALREHNAWRSGEGKHDTPDDAAPTPMPHTPKELGLILDEAATALETYAQEAAKWRVSEQEILECVVDRLGWPEINAFNTELRKGQSVYEDGGGYFIRAMRRLFGLPKKDEEVINYQQALKSALARAEKMGV